MMKKESKQNEIVIAPWINSHARRATPPAKAVAVYEEQEPQEKPSEPEPKNHWKTIAVGALLFALMAGVGAYAGSMAAHQVKIHTVKEGETLWDITKHEVGEEQDARKIYWQIMKDNGLDQDATIHPGQQLVIKF